MSRSNDVPIFNLKAVVQETGLKPDTLRAWERRYGIPEPNRAPSGHRLYTQRDIDLIKWLIARQDEGLSISRAVALWEQRRQEEGDTVEAPLHQGEYPPATAVPPGPLSADRRSYYGEPAASAMGALQDGLPAIVRMRKQWIVACLAFDEQGAENVLSSAFALFATEVVCQDLMLGALAEIGEGWYAGSVTVQQEHFASALALRRLEALLSALPPPTRSGKILVGCPAEEAHTLIALMITFLLRRQGWNVIYLGADIPIRSLELTIKSTQPSVVVLTAQQLHTAASLLEMAQMLHLERIPLGYGGLIFNRLPELQALIPGYFLGTQLGPAIELIENLIVKRTHNMMAVSQPKAATRTVEREYLDALHHFQERRAVIEADVWRSMAHSGMPQRHLASANNGMGRNIIAALALGNVDFLGPDIEWVEGMLVNHYNMPPHLLGDYLHAYYGATRAHLGISGHPLVRWLAQLLGVAHELDNSPAENANISRRFNTSKEQ
jgi:MerR family transcriptional regulator, light-induced transcriptional regulator